MPSQLAGPVKVLRLPWVLLGSGCTPRGEEDCFIICVYPPNPTLKEDQLLRRSLINPCPWHFCSRT